MKHLIEPKDLTDQEVDGILDLADRIIADPKTYAHKCDGKKLATLFYEPSTRPRLSFEAAMLELGGSVLGYADIVAMRHPKEGSAKVASLHADIPVINAGDGGHQHPTQTLTDLLTIRRLKGRLDNFTIGLCGDLKFGRTVHSLIRMLLRYPNISFVLISPNELRVPDYLREELEDKQAKFKEVERLEEIIGELDILYMTRVQRERFFNEEDYVRLRDSYILDMDKMKMAMDDMIVLHPLPRVNEISVEVDSDPRACYFKQALCGKYVRMALMLKMLGLD